MKLKDVILNCNQYIDSDEIINLVFVQMIDDRYHSSSNAKVIGLTHEEIEMQLSEIEQSKCPGFKYFLEMNIIQDIFNDISNMIEYKYDDEKVKRIIYYAEFDA